MNIQYPTIKVKTNLIKVLVADIYRYLIKFINIDL